MLSQFYYGHLVQNVYYCLAIFAIVLKKNDPFGLNFRRFIMKNMHISLNNGCIRENSNFGRDVSTLLLFNGREGWVYIFIRGKEGLIFEI